MKLKEVSSNDLLTQQVLAEMSKTAPVLDYLEFYTMTGNADYKRKASAASGGKFRAIDSDYSDNKQTPQFANPALKILGDKVQVDKAHERRGMDIASVRVAELLSFSRNYGRIFQDKFFNGDADVEGEFDGLKSLMPEAQVITASENGLTVELGNTAAQKTVQQKFLELIDSLIESIPGGAQMIMADSLTLSRLNTIAREFISYELNEFGVRIAFYNKIPLLSSGYKPDGSRVITHTETCGNVATCTSLYAARFGENSDLTFATNKGLVVDDLGLVGVHYTHSVEMDLAPALLDNKSIARLEGIIIS